MTLGAPADVVRAEAGIEAATALVVEAGHHGRTDPLFAPMVALAQAHAAIAQAAATLALRETVADGGDRLADRLEAAEERYAEALEHATAVNNEHSPWGQAVEDVGTGLRQVVSALDGIQRTLDGPRG